MVPGTWVRSIETGKCMYFVGCDCSGNRVFSVTDGEVQVFADIPIESFEILDGDPSREWFDATRDHSEYLDDDSIPPAPPPDDMFGDGGGDDEEEESLWGIRERYSHRHTLTVVCGTAAEVELDFPAASGWEIERLFP